MSIHKRGLFLLPILLWLAYAAPAAAQTERVITVSGQGEVRAVPDRATLSLGVEARGENLTELRTRVNQVVDELLALVASLGIEPRYLRAPGITIRPEYRWNATSEELRFIGYYVSRQVQVELRDLARLGDLIEGAVRRGVNQITEPVLDVVDREGLRRQALTLAAEDARANAQVLATAFGATLGAVRAIDAVEQGYTPSRMSSEILRLADASGGAQNAAYEVGEIRFQASLVAQFDLLAP